MVMFFTMSNYSQVFELHTVGQNIQQVGRRDEVESRERETLCVEVFGKRFLAERQPTLNILKVFVEIRSISGFHYVWSFFQEIRETLQFFTIFRTRTGTVLHSQKYLP